MRAAGYIRVSTEMQAEQGHSLDTQRTLITEYARAKGWTLVTVFSDVGISGTLSNRPGLQALLDRAGKGDFDVVIVHALDRFYRNLPRLLVTLEQLRAHRVAFVSISEQLDFTSPWGKLELALLGSLAEIYIDKLRAETTKGKQARARKGLWNGSIPFGCCNGLCLSCTDVNGPSYCPNHGQPNRSDGATLVAHPIERRGVELAYHWYQSGENTDAEIAQKLNAFVVTPPDGAMLHFRTKRCLRRGGPQPFTRDSVRDLLQRIAYTGLLPYYGKTPQGKKLKRRSHSALALGQQPGLISRELFERCRQVRHWMRKGWREAGR